MGSLGDASENLRLPLSCFDGLDIEEHIEAVGFQRELDGAREVLTEVFPTVTEEYGSGAHRAEKDAPLPVRMSAMRPRVAFSSRVTVLMKMRGLFMTRRWDCSRW